MQDKDLILQSQNIEFSKNHVIARELEIYEINIAALSKMWEAEEGKITEEGAVYIFFRSEQKRVSREEGVRFAIWFQRAGIM